MLIPRAPTYRRTMADPVSIVAVSGSLHAPSKTTVLAHELLTAFADSLDDQVPVETHLIELSEVGRDFSGALTRAELSPVAAEALRRIESATLLIVASPVYRASFTGLFKHVFDFVGQYSLIDKPVQLAATGGSDRHALIIDHQFRPLFSFFQAITLPIGVYASDADFVDYRIESATLRERIGLAVQRGVPVVRGTLPDAVSEYVSNW
jgi:FMN reductase